jgi:hypothetical protein
MTSPSYWKMVCRYVARLLSHPLVPLFAAIAAILITFSSVKTGLWADDEIHAAVLTPHNALKDIGMISADSHRFKNAIMTLYQWTGRGKLRKSLGLMFPWWGDTEMASNFWRPLASASLWLDYKLWPQNTALMHLENVLWFALAAFLVTLCYRRFVGGWAAGVAAILFVSNPEFPAVVAWIAARYAIMTLALGICALLFHHKWRASGSMFGAAASWVALVLCLLSGEGGIAAAGYILGYGIFYEKSDVRSRILSILPATLIVLIWQVSYKTLGYGAHYSMIYVDPSAEPIRYLASLFRYGPILLLNITGQLRMGLFMTMSSHVQDLIWIGAMAQWCVALALLWPMLRNDRRAAFLLAGALMSLIPACSSASVNERSLFFIAFGGIGLAALALEAAAKGVTWLDGHRVRRVLVSTGALAVVLLHAAHPLWMLVRSHINGLQYSTSIKTNARAIDVDKSDFGAGKNIIVVNTGETFGFVTHAFPHRAYKKIALPQGMGLLTGTYHNVRITRTDSSTLVFNTPGGTGHPFLAQHRQLLHRHFPQRSFSGFGAPDACRR